MVSIFERFHYIWLVNLHSYFYCLFIKTLIIHLTTQGRPWWWLYIEYGEISKWRGRRRNCYPRESCWWLKSITCVVLMDKFTIFCTTQMCTFCSIFHIYIITIILMCIWMHLKICDHVQIANQLLCPICIFCHHSCIEKQFFEFRPCIIWYKPIN